MIQRWPSGGGANRQSEAPQDRRQENAGERPMPRSARPRPIQIRPGVPNAKEGGPFFHLTGYEVVR